ncbi:MAG: hypothetical protein NTW64_01235 [Candidatus Omnitrophica bacterium]|nr:hypothetical protein [Candidatus Omnitrophota bacterium]
MKKIVVMALIIGSLAIGISTHVFASDWDKAGKALTIIEGLRVFTGGAVDIIGTITGINRPRQETREYSYSRDSDRRQYASNNGWQRGQDKYERCERVWVPHYAWKVKYVPTYTEYRPGYGEVIVEAHYERYQVEEGGHWEIRYDREYRPSDNHRY